MFTIYAVYRHSYSIHSYSNWYPGEPNSFNYNPDCACLYSTNSWVTGFWDDSPCSNSKSFICERPIPIPDSSWLSIDDNLYYISRSEKYSYSFAQRFCQEQGGDLAQSKTEAINNKLLEMAQGGSYWIGVDSLSMEGTFRWVDGSALETNTFPTWSGKNNTIWTGERCVHQFTNKGWSERPCESYIRFVCQRNIDSVRCPSGYFGSNCAEICNCRDNNPCDKDSGNCPQLNEGECAVGYAADFSHSPDSCTNFVGCYSSCSKTCHCSGGVDDCNSVSGVCSSGRCHPRWTGDRCQSDRFSIVLEKTNPGVANFSCTVLKSTRQILTSDDIKVVVGSFSIDNLIPKYNSEDQNGSVVNSFYSADIGTEHVYCFTGDPIQAADFAFVRLPVTRDFFVLPTLSSPPELVEVGLSYVIFAWDRWDPESDAGEGPIVGYKVYVQSGDDIVVEEETAQSAATYSGALIFNATDLQDGTSYSIQVSTIRYGANGEGERGPTLNIVTLTQSTASPTGTCSAMIYVCEDELTRSRSSSLPSWILFAVSMLGNVILSGIIVFFVRERRSNARVPPISSQTKTISDPSPYENPVFDASNSDTHTYQDLKKADKDATYEEIEAARLAEYVNTVDL